MLNASRMLCLSQNMASESHANKKNINKYPESVSKFSLMGHCTSNDRTIMYNETYIL